MRSSFFAFAVLFVSLQVSAQHENHTTPKDTVVKAKSPRTESMALIGENHVHIDYGAPSVRGRNIWNGLVAYGQVWATGAHKATWIEFSSDVQINNKLIPKGKYGFFTIPDKNQWTLILSKDWDMHLADDYKAESDIIRIVTKPKKNKFLTEALKYQVIKTGNDKGKVEISWEYLSVSFDFSNTKS
jgi:hypothetical protein